LPLWDELFLLAHDFDTGVIRQRAHSLEMGLAGAALIELILEGRVALHAGRIVVLAPE